MKVLTFTTLYPNNISPTNGIFVKERMANFALLNGGHLKVVAPVPYYPRIRLGGRSLYSRIPGHELIDGLDVHHPRYFMTPKVGMFMYGVEMFLSVLPRVSRIRTAFDFDLIDAHYIYPDGFAAVLIGKYLQKPVVVSARGSDISQYSEFPIIRGLLKYTLSRAQRVIAVCQALKDAMVSLATPSDKIAVIPNGVDATKFFPIPKDEARRRSGLPLDKTIILSVGGLIARKGFDLLIRAFKILFEDVGVNNVFLVIIGDGPLRRDLEKMISTFSLNNHIRLVGSIPHSDLYLWYNSADLFCLTSHREGWPNVIMESIACATPVVATDVWGVPEILCSEGIGVLAQQDERNIAEKIAFALKRTWNRDEISRHTAKRTWSQVAISLRNVFQSAVDEFSRKISVRS